jgi:hypothetical protein
LVSLSGRIADSFFSEVFESTGQASEFFAQDRWGYSPVRGCGEFEGVELNCHSWSPRNFLVDECFVREFAALSEQIRFDHALIMRDIGHDWSELPRLPG